MVEVHPGLCRYCRASTLTATSDGRVIYTTSSRAPASGGWRSRMQRWRAKPAQFAAFRAQLAPYRPDGERVLAGVAACKAYVPDGRSTVVRWRGGGAPGMLVVNSGCDPAEHRAMTDAILSSPALLAAGTRPRG